MYIKLCNKTDKNYINFHYKSDINQIYKSQSHLTILDKCGTS